MIEETAVVSRIDKHQAWVRATSTSSCGKCVQQASCSSQILGKYFAKRELPVDTDLFLKQGDKIIVAIDENQLIKGSLLIYMLPLIALFIGALLGENITTAWPVANPDLIISLIAITGFCLVLLALNKYQHTLLTQQFARPIVLRKL